MKPCAQTHIGQPSGASEGPLINKWPGQAGCEYLVGNAEILNGSKRHLTSLAARPTLRIKWYIAMRLEGSKENFNVGHTRPNIDQVWAEGKGLSLSPSVNIFASPARTHTTSNNHLALDPVLSLLLYLS